MADPRGMSAKIIRNGYVRSLYAILLNATLSKRLNVKQVDALMRAMTYHITTVQRVHDTQSRHNVNSFNSFFRHLPVLFIYTNTIDK